MVLIAVILSAGHADPLAGQTEGGQPAAPFLEPDDWALRALERLDALGLLPPGYDPGSWTLDRRRLLWLMEEAVTRAGEAPGGAELAREYAERARAEYTELTSSRVDSRWWRGRAAVGYRFADGGARTAIGWPPDEDGWPPLPEVLPAVLPRSSTGEAAVDLSGGLGSQWSGRLGLRISDAGLELGPTYLLYDLGGTTLWAGRRRIWLGAGQGRVIASGALAMDGGGVDIEPFRVPGVLDHLGWVNFGTAIVQLGAVDPYDNPLLWLMRGSIEPHPRLRIGLNRGTMVPEPEEMSAEWLAQLPLVLTGKHTEGELDREENTIVSLDVSYDAPIPQLPVTLYLEWGFEDSAGAWRSVPGIVGGVYLPRLPGMPWLSARLEQASFAEMCCGNPWWYRHRGFKGGWTSGRQPLAHPLGGHGRESSLRLRATLHDARLLAGAVAYHRDRGIENLYAPTREGVSTGGALEATLFLSRRLELSASLEHEAGGEWDRTHLSVRAATIF